MKKRLCKPFYFLFIHLIYLSGSSQSSTPKFIKNEIDSYIEKGIKDWNVPGLAIVIVQNDKIIKLKGYGFADKKKT